MSDQQQHVVENNDGAFVASFATRLLADFFVAEGSGCYRHRLADTPPEPAATANDIVAEVVGLARRDIARTQTDFLGRMAQALCEYEGAFDQYPDGDLPDDVREDADCQIAGLAGLALAQLAMLRSPSDALALLKPAATARAAMREAEQRTFARLSGVARAIGWQAGVGARETAGAIVSYLATSPDEIAPFVAGSLSPLDFKGDWVRGGCLTWQTADGKVWSPEEAVAARAAKATHSEPAAAGCVHRCFECGPAGCKRANDPTRGSAPRGRDDG